MTTVQLAITDPNYTRRLERLLLDDGDHRVIVVDHPSSKYKGVIVASSEVLGDFSIVDDPDRLVVVASRKAYFRTSQLWAAGLRHVVYDTDPPITAYLAILSTEQAL